MFSSSVLLGKYRVFLFLLHIKKRQPSAPTDVQPALRPTPSLGEFEKSMRETIKTFALVITFVKSNIKMKLTTGCPLTRLHTIYLIISVKQDKKLSILQKFSKNHSPFMLEVQPSSLSETIFLLRQKDINAEKYFLSQYEQCRLPQLNKPKLPLYIERAQRVEV